MPYRYSPECRRSWVVEAFDVVEHCCAGLVSVRECGAVEEFGLEGGEERFGYGVDAPIVKYWCRGWGRWVVGFGDQP